MLIHVSIHWALDCRQNNLSTGSALWTSFSNYRNSLIRHKYLNYSKLVCGEYFILLQTVHSWKNIKLTKKKKKKKHSREWTRGKTESLKKWYFISFWIRVSRYIKTNINIMKMLSFVRDSFQNKRFWKVHKIGF